MSKSKEANRLDETAEDEFDFLEPDINKLVWEWVRQPKLFFHWSEKLRKARKRLERAERDFKLTQSEIDLKIRKSPKKYGLSEKPLEKAIANVVLQKPKFKAAQKIVFKIQDRVNTLKNVVVSLDQRKKALEKLVDLHGQQYFATPRASEQSKDAVEEMLKASARKRKKKVKTQQ